MRTATQTCDKRGGYAEWPCVLEGGHEGNHRDSIDREWDAAGEGVTPVIDPDKITDVHALRIAEDLSGYDEDGVIEIEGIKVGWWADADCVWFYNPGDSGEDTIKRFAVERDISVWAEPNK